MSGYQITQLCQEPVLHEPFTGSPVPVSDLAGDIIIVANRESSTAQEPAHNAKFAYIETTIGSVGKKVIKKAFIGSGRLKPLYDYNETHGLALEYTHTWFGVLEDSIKEAQCQSFPGQRITVLLLTPDRLARPRYFHPHQTLTWGLTHTDSSQFDTWKRARFNARTQYVRFLTCFAGTPGECRGFQTQLGMRYFGNLGGRPKGSKNKKPQVPTLTPKQKTAWRKILRAEIPHLVGEWKLNGTQCYNYLTFTHNGYIPVTRQTVCKWVAQERGTPGTPGRPLTADSLPNKVPPPKKECNLLKHRPTRPPGTHPALVRVKRIRSIDRPPLPKRVNKSIFFFPHSRIRGREIYEPP